VAKQKKIAAEREKKALAICQSSKEPVLNKSQQVADLRVWRQLWAR
jgi:hypothetical protein